MVRNFTKLATFFVLTLQIPLVLAEGRCLTTDACSAVEKIDDGKFQKKFKRQLAVKTADLVFIGDSITEGWSIISPHRTVDARKIWESEFSKYKAANFGTSGDKTQNVIWRIKNGLLDTVKPKVVVLLIGTNNTGSYPANEIASGIETIVDLIRVKIPKAKILVVEILPRVKSGSKMNVVDRVNQYLAHLDNGESVRVLDFKKIIPNYRIESFTKKYLFDGLHLNLAGYQKYAQLLKPYFNSFFRDVP